MGDNYLTDIRQRTSIDISKENIKEADYFSTDKNIPLMKLDRPFYFLIFQDGLIILAGRYNPLNK